jgi:hypothetical protein
VRIDRILKALEQISAASQDVAAVSQEQAASSEEIAEAVQDMANKVNDATSGTANVRHQMGEISAAAERLAQGAEELSRLGAALRERMAFFRMEEDAEGPAGAGRALRAASPPCPALPGDRGDGGKHNDHGPAETLSAGLFRFCAACRGALRSAFVMDDRFGGFTAGTCSLCHAMNKHGGQYMVFSLHSLRFSSQAWGSCPFASGQKSFCYMTSGLVVWENVPCRRESFSPVLRVLRARGGTFVMRDVFGRFRPFRDAAAIPFSMR